MLQLGCDPEVFLEDATSALISSIGIVGGSKWSPRPLPLGPGFAVQEDNVALEFNIPPAQNSDEYVAFVRQAREYLRGEMQQHGLNFSKLSAAVWPSEQLQHPDAQQFGCTPDFNAWKNGARNPRPRADDPNLRSCGGHVHVGYEFNDQQHKITFIKYMDLYLGVPSVLMDNGELRKRLYGKPGAFRYTDYGGVEYRVLSNFWIFEDDLISWVWRQTERALKDSMDDHQDINGQRTNILGAINNNNRELAMNLVNQYQIEMR